MQRDAAASGANVLDSFSRQDWERFVQPLQSMFNASVELISASRFRLRGMWSAIKSSEDLISRYKDQLSAFITQDSGYRDYVSNDTLARV